MHFKRNLDMMIFIAAFSLTILGLERESPWPLNDLLISYWGLKPFEYWLPHGVSLGKLPRKYLVDST